jgi:hypothetical protein
LASITPFVEAYPQAFGELAVWLARGYLEASQRAGIEPNTEFLGRVARALGMSDESAG